MLSCPDKKRFQCLLVPSVRYRTSPGWCPAIRLPVCLSAIRLSAECRNFRHHQTRIGCVQFVGEGYFLLTFSVMESDDMMASIFFAFKDGINASSGFSTNVHCVLMRLHNSLARSISKPTSSPCEFLIQMAHRSDRYRCGCFGIAANAAVAPR